MMKCVSRTNILSLLVHLLFPLISCNTQILRRPSKMSTSLSVDPRVAMVDEPVVISVSGLLPNQLVTVHARLVERGLRLLSYGHFTATSDGTLDLTQHSSTSGTYTGVDPMGLFWSMTFEPGQRAGQRLLKKDVSTPWNVTITVLNDHLSLESLCSGVQAGLCQQDVLRWHWDKRVKRKEIRHGNIRATMFVPPGPGPHPGVIVIHGAIAGLLEYRSSLLASHGFTTLALAWFDFEDLPKLYSDVDFKYFVEAVDWFSSQLEVLPSGIGFVGISKGSNYALMLGIYCPLVTAVVSVSGTPFPFLYDIKFGDAFLPAVRWKDLQGSEKNGEFEADRKTVKQKHLFDYEKMKARVLLLAGEDDPEVPPSFQEQALSKLTPRQRAKFTSITYPKAGHVLELPYSPVCLNSYDKILGVIIRWGGEVWYSAKAQEKAWKATLSFLKVNLTGCPDTDNVSKI